jgi:hypothetical protein
MQPVHIPRLAALLFLTTAAAPALRSQGHSSGAPTTSPLQAACPQGVLDLVTGMCVPVSSVPMAGALLPLGRFLHVASSGNVGIGTQTPARRLDVAGSIGSEIPSGSVSINTYSPSTVPSIRLKNSAGSHDWVIYPSSNDVSNLHIVTHQTNRPRVSIAGNGDHKADLRVDGNIEAGEDLAVTGTTTTGVLTITGGADLVEGFAGAAALTPGTVVVIDAQRAGAVRACTAAYDPGVAGAVSGAGGVHPGIRLGQTGVLDGDAQITLAGRVYVKCSTANGAIRPGDMLTTSAVPGHAMRATDRERAFGSVFGKAMSSLEDGDGLVLVLVNLQ